MKSYGTFSSGRSSGRVSFLDEARGLCVALMVLYHAAFDLVYLFGVNIPFFHAAWLDGLQSFFAGMFILISGVCCRYSRNNLRRGVAALAVGLVITAVTWRFIPQTLICFGVLHLLGCAMILFALLEKLLDALPAFWGLLLMALLFALTWGVPQGYLGFFGLFEIPLPAFLYELFFLFPLGFPGPNFFSSDYVPLLPWIFCFFAGGYLGTFFTMGYMPAPLYRTHSPALAAVGRKSLPIYVLHQPLVYVLLKGFFAVFGGLFGR